MSIPAFLVFLGSIIGQQLAPDPGLATLPVGAFILGSALATLPVILGMRRWGRKRMFIFCAAISVAGGLLAIYSLTRQSFVIFVSAGVILGLGLAAGQQYRFAAMECVAPEDMPRAASRVLLGGIVAAFLGPEIAVRGEHLFEVAYAGSFVLLTGLTLLAMVILLFLNAPAVQDRVVSSGSRGLFEILAQPVIWVAVVSGLASFAVMSTVMIATPLHMHFENGHSLAAAKWVIQSHIVAMFLPSFFVPWLIRRVGEVGLISLGAGAFVVAAAVIFSRYEFINYWLSLVLLGVGWNFLFVGGTTLLPLGYREAEKFKVQAFNDFIVFGVQAFCALMAGWLLTKIGWQNLLLTMIPVLAVLAIAVFYWLWSRKPEPVNPW